MLAKSWSAGNAIQLNNHKISPVLSVQRLIIFLTYSSVFHRENLRSVVTFFIRCDNEPAPWTRFDILLGSAFFDVFCLGLTHCDILQ